MEKYILSFGNNSIEFDTMEKAIDEAKTIISRFYDYRSQNNVFRITKSNVELLKFRLRVIRSIEMETLFID